MFFEERGIEAKYIRNQYNTPFVYIDIDGGKELLAVPSDRLALRIRSIFHANGERMPSRQSICEIMENISSECLFNGERRNVHVRIAPLESDIEIDLGYEDNACIRVSSDGWNIYEEPVNLFFRPTSQLPLPRPDREGNIFGLLPLLNHQNEKDFVLLVGYMLGVLRPESNYCHLVLQGEQGCGKTTVTTVIKRLIDNSTAETRAFPNRQDDLLIAAQNSHLLSFDNLSGIRPTQSDNLCRLATGGSLGTRRFYTNTDEVLMHARRPVILNGIDDIATRPDLASRCIIVTLPRIRERTSDTELRGNFESKAGGILGSLLNGLSSALRNYSAIDVQRSDAPRMLDFLKWAEAGCRGIGFAPNFFLNSYLENQSNASRNFIELDTVANALIEMMQQLSTDYWEGTAAELLEKLEGYAPARRPRNWPDTATYLSNHLSRISQSLEDIGIKFERLPRTANRRALRLTKTVAFEAYLAAMNEQTENTQNDGMTLMT